jgi:hypothetical protein
MEQILKDTINIYHYGSKVYGTYQEDKSDLDFIVILPDGYDIPSEQIDKDNCQYCLYHESTWKQKLLNHDVDAIETYFLPAEFIIKETKKFNIKIDPIKIRESFSRTASNSWVKCKKKLEVPESFNPRVAKKSLWHALRIIEFGTQIMLNGRIVNYKSMSHVYEQIVECPNNYYPFYKEKYQGVYNSLKHVFRESTSFCSWHNKNKEQGDK